MELTGQPISLSQIAQIAIAREPVAIASSAHARIRESRAVIDAITESEAVVYGVNTGFGKLSEVHIERGDLGQLQLNLVRSHACGIGAPLSEPEVRAMMLLRANVLALGFSGIRLEVIEFLAEMLNRGVHPMIPEKGSVGASGDLAPLAHLSLALVGEGEAFFDGGRMPSAAALSRAGLKPIRLEAKEGLALLNGTQAMHAAGGLALLRAKRLSRVADVIGAMTLEALKGTPTAFDPRIQNARPHPGQKAAAAHLCWLLRESEIRESHKTGDPRVQDAYSLRCSPQVLGAVADAIAFARTTAEIELNASTDNPLVFDNGDVLSGGNFHGQPVAQALDVLAIALTTLQAIAERRVERLVNPDLSQGLPAFLTADPGLSSGYMMVQITAASLVAESRTLAMPASIGSIPTDANQEDFVPMGMAAAFKARRILLNAARVVAAELLCGAQALELLRPLAPGRGVGTLYQRIRDAGIAPLGADRPPAPYLERLAARLAAGAFDPAGWGDA